MLTLGPSLEYVKNVGMQKIFSRNIITIMSSSYLYRAFLTYFEIPSPGALLKVRISVSVMHDGKIYFTIKKAVGGGG